MNGWRKSKIFIHRRKRQKTFTGRRRQDTDLSATTTAINDTCETSEDNPSGSSQKIIGTSRKKMRRGSSSVDSEFERENPEYS